MERNIDLVNLRHIYAPRKDDGHICMPTSLISAMARMQVAGVETRFFDENISPYAETSLNVGTSLVGAVSLPGALELQKRTERDGRAFVLGGQIVDSLTPGELSTVFPKKAWNGNNAHVLAHVLKFDRRALPESEDISHISAYEAVPEDMMARYLQAEIPLHVSQGCKYNCSICSALKKQPEVYRDIDLIEKDMEWLVSAAEILFLTGELSKRELNFYFSNLDTFQSPKKLEAFTQAMQRVRRNHVRNGQEFDIRMRGLSTTREFLIVAKKHPNIIQDLVNAGFHTVGFGIDGMTAAVWKGIRKAHNFSKDTKRQDAAELCIDAIKVAASFGITSEILMVFGHMNIRTLEPLDTDESMRLAYEFLDEMQTLYGAVPRPQVMKPYPGNDLWKNKKYQPMAESVVRFPEAFQALDFVGRANPVSHPDTDFRNEVNFYLDQMTELDGNRSRVIEPIELSISKTQSGVGKIVDGIPDGAWKRMCDTNEGKFDR